MKFKLLALGPQNVIPANNGGRESIYGALRSLSNYFDVTYAYYSSDLVNDEDYSKIGINSICLGESDDSIKNIITSVFKLHHFKFSKYYTEVAFKKISSSFERFDLILSFHPHMYKLAEECSNFFEVKDIYLRAHNVEYQIVSNYIEEKLGVFSFIAAPLVHLAKKHELAILSKSKLTFCISDSDFNIFKTCVNNDANLRLLYDGVCEGANNADADHSYLTILFNKKSEQNIVNLKKFLNEIWYLSSRALDYKLMITGVKLDELSKIVCIPAHILNDINVVCVDYLPDLTLAYQKSLATLSITYVGSGIRKKILESMSNSTPVIMTEFDFQSCEVFDSSNCLNFKTRQDFIDAVNQLKNNDFRSEIIKNAKLLIERHFDWSEFGLSIYEEFVHG